MRRRFFGWCVLLSLLLVAPVEAAGEAYGPGDWVTVLLVANAGPDGTARDADSAMAIFSLNPARGIVKLSCVAWNTLVELDGETRTLAQAFRSGGAPRVAQALRDNLGVSADEYLSIGLPGLIELVDLYGGIAVNVDEWEADRINALLALAGRGGDVTAEDTALLDGFQAVAYGGLCDDSVMNGCLRQAEVVCGLFFRAYATLVESAVFYTDASSLVIPHEDQTIPCVNLDHLTEADAALIYSALDPLLERAETALSREDAIAILTAFLKAADTAFLEDTTATDEIQFLLMPFEVGAATENGDGGLSADLPANAQILDMYLYNADYAPTIIRSPYT